MGISSALHLFGYKPNFLTNLNFLSWRWRYMKGPRIIRGSSVYPCEFSRGWNVPFLESQQNYLQFQNIKTTPVLVKVKVCCMRNVLDTAQLQLQWLYDINRDWQAVIMYWK